MIRVGSGNTEYDTVVLLTHRSVKFMNGVYPRVLNCV